MPHRFSFADHDAPSPDDMHDITAVDPPDQDSRSRKARVLGRLNSFSKLKPWRRKEEEVKQVDQKPIQEVVKEENAPQIQNIVPGQSSQRSRSLSPQTRKVVPELPRQLTFTRQYSERRERLEQHEPSSKERRAYSEDRRAPYTRDDTSLSAFSPSSAYNSQADASHQEHVQETKATGSSAGRSRSHSPDVPEQSSTESQPLDQSVTLPDQPSSTKSDSPLENQDESDVINDEEFQRELDSRWILNLSMHFRDKSDREKFFITYAQEPNRWRRLTVSCDYRKAKAGSLEYDLKRLHTQRDKSSRIYEAIRDSLPDIQFLDTVTNLKLETDHEEGRLHVHVTEDLNEIINFPSVSLLSHIRERHQTYRESDLEFKQHLSGFVYKVYTGSEYLIKKEIPGPETIDEFLYEIAALDALRGAESVIQFRGLVVDDEVTVVKAILITFASKGSLIDTIYDERDNLEWHTRCKWARQIIKGLAEIHEAGFVQGDFTLSNIVIDNEDDAKIIDINRRGCPVGWEPPELRPLIESGQRIAMMIGVKTDIYQLGMVLWALAELNDEPERVERPLFEDPDQDPRVPLWYRDMIRWCLDDRPQMRLNAKDLLAFFDEYSALPPPIRTSKAVEFLDNSVISGSSHRSDKEYIDPHTAVDLEDIEEVRQAARASPKDDAGPSTWYGPPSTADYHLDSSGSYIVTRGRSLHSGRRRSSPSPRSRSSVTSMSSANNDDRKWEHIYAEEAPIRHDSSMEGTPLGRGPAGGVGMGPHKFFQDSSDLNAPEEARHVTRASCTNNEALEADIGRPSQDVDVACQRSPPLHQDSGFDEEMIKDLTMTASNLATNQISLYESLPHESSLEDRLPRPS
ncbi:hypothetical protein MBLNU457_6364t1 [Dothideomycetes sp. NU457]